MKKLTGITGGIGSGKTSVARFIEALGFPVYNSDTRAKEIVNTDSELKEKIILLLGPEAYDGQGVYQRKFVAEKVFNDNGLLHQLNELIHPAVKNDFERWFEAQTSEWVFKETALLFELGLYKSCYKSILVTADDNLRIKRVMDRDGKTYREVEAIVKKQMPERTKIRHADFVIYNNGSLDELETETRKVLEKLMNNP